jgi:hypothetical protein
MLAGYLKYTVEQTSPDTAIILASHFLGWLHRSYAAEYKEYKRTEEWWYLEVKEAKVVRCE